MKEEQQCGEEDWEGWMRDLHHNLVPHRQETDKAKR